jgi:hypothetical protein
MFLESSNTASTFDNVVVYGLSPIDTVPDAPTIGTATAGNASASVTFTAPSSNGGNAITSSALEFKSNEYNVSTNPYGVDSTNDIIYFPFAHNLNTGSAVLYNAQSNAVTTLVTGQVYYAVFISTTSIRLATTYANAIEAAKTAATNAFNINLTATSVQETHTLTDVNQKAQASMEDDPYIRILPDIQVGGDSTSYGGTNPLSSGKGILVTSDDPDNYIDHSFTADNLPSFNTAIVKIVMRSQNPAYVTKVKDLRVIATA